MPNSLDLSLSKEIFPKVEHVDAELVSIDELEEMSLEEVQRAKKQLAEQRKRVQLSLDKNKIRQSKEIMNNMGSILNVMARKLAEDDVSAKDVRDLSSAYSELIKSLNMITRLDSVDGTGRATMLSIEVKYKET